LALQFPNIPSGSYNVWETDYTGYTLIYSCTQVVPFVLKSELIWILSRTPTLEFSTVDRLRNLLSQNGVGTVSRLLITDQSC
jgi:lipocalin